VSRSRRVSEPQPGWAWSLIAAVPLPALPVLVYNLIALALGGIMRAGASGRLGAALFSMRTSAGGVWPVSLSDLLLTLALVTLFVEMVRPSPSRRVAIVNHALGMVLFVACLIEILIAPAFATSTFFLITLTVLLNVLAGFMLTVARPEEDEARF
jgi:hypothetical protein